VSDAAPLTIVVAGQWQPDLIPFCQICELPVEVINMHPFREHHQDFLIIEAHCCGQTSGSRVSLRAIWAMKARGEKWFAIVKRGLAPGAREIKRSSFAGMHG
jgi:hypothetical protein